MKTEKLKQSYKDQLVKAGVDPHRAEEVAKVLTSEPLQLTASINRMYVSRLHAHRVVVRDSLTPWSIYLKTAVYERCRC